MQLDARRCTPPDGMTNFPSDVDETAHLGRRCPIIGSPPRKVSPGRQFTGKNPPRQSASRAGRIFTGELSAAEETFPGGRSYDGETFYGAGDILIRGDI